MVNHNVSMSKYDHTTPKRSLGEQAHDVIAPYATLYKLFKEGIPTSMLPDGRTDMETRVYDTYGSATFGTSKLVECFVPLGISGDGMKHKIAIKYAPFRRVSVSCGLSLDDKPAYSELFSSFEAALRLPPDQFALNYLSAGDDHDDATQLPQTIQLSIIQLVSAVRSNLGCWSDEAPILRCLSLMMTTAHSEDILSSTSIFPRFAADAYLDGPVKHWVDPEPPAGVSCTIMMADFVTFMRIYSGHYSLPTCMDRYIVIPFTGHDSEGAELIVRILCYTDTIWWNGRVLMEALVKSAKTKSTHDVLYFAHLASLCKIPNGLGTHDGFKILLVTPNESYASIRLTGPDRKTYRVPRIDPRTSVSLQTKNYTEFEDKDFPNPMTITGLLHSWLAPDNFYTLSWAARTVLNKFLDHNVGSSAQAMIMLAAELFAYVPLEKVINDTNLKSGTHQGFGVFAWELDDPDSKTRLNSSEPISPQIVLKDELKKQGHGTLPDALNWMAHANHTPLGIVNPGKVELNLDFTTHAMNTKISEGDGLYCYTAKEADNISRLATYLGPMIVHSPHRTPLTYSPMQYMQEVSSLLAGIGGWMALSAGYTFFDMARLDSELSWDDATLHSTIYNTYIAEPINQVTLGHISFNHNHMRSHVHRVNLPEMIAALPLSDWMMDISAYDGWSLPGWYIAAICKNFSGKDAKVGNDSEILLNPARCTQLGISGRPARAVRMNEETDPMDFLALTTVFDVTELKLACLSPIDGQLKMAYRRFDIYSWLNYREPIKDMRWKTARGPCPESASYILPRLRYTEGEHGSGIQCEYYVLNTPALVSCGSRTTFMITLNHLDPPTGLFDSYLSNVMSDLSSVAKDLRWADWLEAMPTGTKLAEMLHEHLNGKGDNVGERAKSN